MKPELRENQERLDLQVSQASQAAEDRQGIAESRVHPVSSDRRAVQALRAQQDPLGLQGKPDLRAP